MSYAMADVLQTAVYQTLVNNAGLIALIGANVYDEVPAGNTAETYVVLGSETTIDRSDADGSGAEHRLVISVFSSASGFTKSKQAAVAVSDALHRADLVLARGRLVFIAFDRAVAKRDTVSGLRRIDMRFRARVEDNLIS